ncbi:MAG: methyltransferase family protein [Candidatus Bathycorpusculaceae bacterium]
MPKRLIFMLSVVALVLLFLVYSWTAKFGTNLPSEDAGLLLKKDAWLLVVLGLAATIAALVSLFMELKLSSPITFIGWIFYLPVLFNVLIPMFVLFFSLVGIFYTPWLVFVDMPLSNKLINGVIRLSEYGIDTMIDYVGYILVATGLMVYTISLYQMLSHTLRKRALLTKGLYAATRHPQYLGIYMWTLGFAILGWRLINYFMWLTLCYSYILLAEHEEVELTRVWGQEYVQYKDKVPFIIPYPLSIILKPFSILKNRLKLRLLIYAVVYVVLLLILYYTIEPYVVLYR